MESLESSLAALGRGVTVVHDHRARPYYDRWSWSVTWNQLEVSALRMSLDPRQIHRILENRREWRGRSTKSHGFWAEDINQEVEQALTLLAGWLADCATPHKVVFSYNTIMFYTNDQATVESLARVITTGDMAVRVGGGPVIRIKQAHVTKPADTVLIKRPYAYQYRTYLRSRKMDSGQRQALGNWISGMADAVRASTSLAAFVQGRKTRWYCSDRTWEYHFIDHNDPRLLLWLAMISPDLARKTMTIQSGAK